MCNHVVCDFSPIERLMLPRPTKTKVEGEAEAGKQHGVRNGGVRSGHTYVR